MESFAHEMADAFANLATATAADWHILAELIAANTALTSQLDAKEAVIQAPHRNQIHADVTTATSFN
jgi:hypothetical protein